ncbi:hypothetical protein [Plantactinospora sp. GCM10030261]|uniref:hypothetical protein n=1 Tax=Plantactinospora sp. GCM10030261 TaxID=3273420 RepID=UPI00360C954F
MIVDDRLSDDERMTLKTAGFGAVLLVSNADPGLLSMIKESFAASDTIAASSGLVREVLTGGPLPRLPDDPAAAEEVVFPALRRSVEILSERAPDQVDRFRATIVAAAHRVADATEGKSGGEAAMVAKVMAALGVTP